MMQRSTRRSSLHGTVAGGWGRREYPCLAPRDDGSPSNVCNGCSVLLNGSITDTNFAASLAEDVKQLWRIACNGVKDENARSIMFKLLYRLIATLPEARRLILQDGSALEVLLGSVSNSAEGRVRESFFG